MRQAAEYSAKTTDPSVFSPAICTFTRPGTAKTRDIRNGLALVIELDEGDTEDALTRIEALIGAATVVVLSGGTWIDPADGAAHAKRHAYWRLSEPTCTEDEHVMLYAARRDAALLTGADPTGKPVVHCYRWPGSINRKNPDHPIVCRIERHNLEAEIHLLEAAELLAEAAEAIGLPSRSTNGDGAYRGKRELTADPALVAAAMAAIPNPDVHYDEWVRWGYAVCGATGGRGYAIWRDWSARSPKHGDGETEAAWTRIHAAGVTRIGAGSIFAEARRHGWIDPRRRGEPAPEWNSDTGPDGANIPEPRRDEPAELPVIFCEAGKLDRMYRETEAALLKAGTPVYQRTILVKPAVVEYDPCQVVQPTHERRIRPR